MIEPDYEALHYSDVPKTEIANQAAGLFREITPNHPGTIIVAGGDTVFDDGRMFLGISTSPAGVRVVEVTYSPDTARRRERKKLYFPNLVFVTFHGAWFDRPTLRHELVNARAVYAAKEHITPSTPLYINPQFCWDIHCLGTGEPVVSQLVSRSRFCDAIGSVRRFFFELTNIGEARFSVWSPHKKKLLDDWEQLTAAGDYSAVLEFLTTLNTEIFLNTKTLNSVAARLWRAWPAALWSALVRNQGAVVFNKLFLLNEFFQKQCLSLGNGEPSTTINGIIEKFKSTDVVCPRTIRFLQQRGLRHE